MSDIKWSKVRAGNYVSEVINDRQYEATKVGSGWIVFVHSEHGSDVQTDGRTLTECKHNVATFLDAHANDDRFPAGQLVWNTNTNQYAKVAKGSTRAASDALIEYLPGHNQPCDTIWASKTTLVPQTNVTPASAFVADPANPTDVELAGALDRGLADGSLIDSTDWLLANHDAEPKLSCAFARSPGHLGEGCEGCEECAKDAQDAQDDALVCVVCEAPIVVLNIDLAYHVTGKACAVCGGPLDHTDAGGLVHADDDDDDHTPVDPGDDAEAALRARIDQVATQIETEEAKRTKPAGRDTSDRCAVCHREAHRPGLRNGNHGHDYVAPTPQDAGPDKCGTVGCKSDATHTLTYSFPESRDQTETDRVCEPCGNGYARRPSLRASLTPVGACSCNELPYAHVVGEHTVLVTGGVDILDRQSATYTPPTVADIIGTVNGGYTVYRALQGLDGTVYVAARNDKGHTATWFVFETWDHRAGFNAGNYWFTSDASDNLAKAGDDLVGRALPSI